MLFTAEEIGRGDEDESDSNQRLLPPNPGPPYETTMLPAQGHDRTQAVSQVAGRHWGLEAGPGDAEAVSCKAKVKVLLVLPQLASHSTTSSSFA